jgi:hypothetical protein
MTQGPLLPPPPQPPNIDIGDKANTLVNNLLGKGLDTLNKKVDDAIESFDNIDVPAIVEQKLDNVANVFSYATSVLTDKDQLLRIGEGISNELKDPKTNKILQDLTKNFVETSGDAAINALPAIPVVGALGVAAIKAGPNITHALNSLNELAEKYNNKLDSITTGATTGATTTTQDGGGGFKLKGILRRSKTIEKRTSESIDKFLNPKKTKTGRRKKTNKRLLSKNKTRKRVRFRL